VRVEGWVIVNCVVFVVPDVGTLPVPVQPVQTSCVTIDPTTGDIMETCMDVPASNQPVVGDGEP